MPMQPYFCHTVANHNADPAAIFGCDQSQWADINIVLVNESKPEILTNKQIIFQPKINALIISDTVTG